MRKFYQVRLKSGGECMLATEIEGGLVKCSWIEKGKYRTIEINSMCLNFGEPVSGSLDINPGEVVEHLSGKGSEMVVSGAKDGVAKCMRFYDYELVVLDIPAQELIRVEENRRF